MSPQETEYAWAAGIIDGEGSFGITRQRPRSGTESPIYRFFLRVSMCHLPTINRLFEIFEKGSFAESKHPRWSTAYTWHLSGQDALVVTNLVYPHLVTKQEEADLGIKFMHLPRNKAGQKLTFTTIEERDNLYMKMREAKSSARFRSIEKWNSTSWSTSSS